MANYTATITIPPNTVPGSPLDVDMTPTHRYIEHCAIWFRKNNAALSGVQLLSIENLIAPTGGSTTYGLINGVEVVGNWIHGNDQLVEWDEDFDLGVGPKKLRVRCYNLDQVYPRMIEVRVTIFDVGMRQLLAERMRTN